MAPCIVQPPEIKSRYDVTKTATALIKWLDGYGFEFYRNEQIEIPKKIERVQQNPTLPEDEKYWLCHEHERDLKAVTDMIKSFYRSLLTLSLTSP